MNLRSKYIAGSVITLSLVAGAAVLQKDSVDPDATAANSLAGVAAGMRFTDDEGNVRLPTEAERAALAEAFQADIANLTKGRGIPVGEKRQRNGSYRAVVGTDKMQFLTVEIDEQGNAVYGHASMDESGRVEPAPANDWPEM